MVYWGSEEKWDNVVAEFDTLGLPCYIAVGNHDMKNPEYYFEQFGDTTYYDFSYKNDLFIILDPNIDSWNISEDQLVFLQNTLSEQADSHDNIFVMMHQLLWWSPDNEYSVITLNSLEGRASEINFWSEIEPLFHELDNNVIMCAGDLGAASYASDFMYDNYDNISYVATGMGKGDTDNFVIINVDENKNVNYELICLSDENLYCFGDLEDYEISPVDPIVRSEQISIYPNPVSVKLSVIGLDDKYRSLEIYSSIGKLVYSKDIDKNTDLEIDCSALSGGVYILRISSISATKSYRFTKI